ncbi:MAG: DUF4365 domain-containing protein [Candidatus Obscuribacter sp.]|nr:DUF4365 domain-containing protein [Candidatus Obscuribacter sp.]MBK9773700.1 DUF4365 domain-containing protein [Candidatus Obscuribacter sp.]
MKKYPGQDSAETASLALLKHMLDKEWIKAHLTERDKVPNIDGFFEIYDFNEEILGKLDIQVKSLPNGARKYLCPMDLVDYSGMTTLPVLLICVDRFNQCAYWKHIHPEMMEITGKKRQKSFTVEFDGSIDRSKSYIIQWIKLAKRYQLKTHSGQLMTLCQVSQRTKEGFRLCPYSEQALWELLLPFEQDHKSLRAAVDFADQSTLSKFNDYTNALKCLAEAERSSNVVFSMRNATGCMLECGNAFLFCEARGSILTLEFRTLGKFDIDEGEIIRLISKSKDKWLNVEGKRSFLSTNKLAAFCIESVIKLSK